MRGAVRCEADAGGIARITISNTTKLNALSAPDQRARHYAYADSAEHREGLAAFNDKRTPCF